MAAPATRVRKRGARARPRDRTAACCIPPPPYRAASAGVGHGRSAVARNMRHYLRKRRARVPGATAAPPKGGAARAAGRADARSWWAKAGGWLRHRSPVAARHARRPGARRAVRRATGRAASLKRCRANLPPMAAPPADRCRTPCMHVRLVRPGIRGRGRGQVYEPILLELPPRVCCLFLSRPWPCCSVWRAPCQMRPSANGCMGR